MSQQNIPNPLLRLSTTPPTLPQFLVKQVLKGPGPQYQTSQPASLVDHGARKVHNIRLICSSATNSVEISDISSAFAV